MLQLHLEAHSFSELRKKALEVLGMISPAQMEMPLGITSATPPSTYADGHNVATGTGPAEAPKALTQSAPLAGLHTPVKTRTRRTKAEIEAERQEKNVGATSKEIIENNFKAGDELDEVEQIETPEITEEALIEDEVAEMETRSFDDCKALAQEILRLKTDKAGKTAVQKFTEILGKFQAAKLSQVDASNYNGFYSEALAVLGRKK